MKILVVGQGGREHALLWKLKQSPHASELFCAPGNAGIEKIARCVPIAANNIDELLKFAQENRIDLTVVGPEAPLTEGIVDRFRGAGLSIFGPDRYASQLEGSKVFAKRLMRKLNIPTAKFEVFDDAESALLYVSKQKTPLVIKADGLAQGKGVTIAATPAEAHDAIEKAMMQKVFGKAGDCVVVEECLEGEEASLIAICDGKTALSLASSQDHKRVFDGDVGPNTGGMGAYSPVPFVTADLVGYAQDVIFKPIIEEMSRQGHPFIGFLYAGVMLTRDGLKVLEFNVRFGDPEAQAILPRLESDFLELILAAVSGGLDKFSMKWSPDPCVCVVLASQGYPGNYPKGLRISGLEGDDSGQAFVFHAGTEKKDGEIVTSGGRVLDVAARGRDISQALERAYESVNKIYFPGMHFRKDIARRNFRTPSVRETQGENR